MQASYNSNDTSLPASEVMNVHVYMYVAVEGVLKKTNQRHSAS